MTELQFFFGEDHTTFSRSIHVVTAAKGILLLEAVLLLIYVVILPSVVGYFDLFCVFQLIVYGCALLITLYEVFREKHKWLWVFMAVKAVEIIMYVFVLSVASLIAIFRKHILLNFLSLRVRTINQSNADLHVFAGLFLLFFHLLYSVLALHAIYNVWEYYRAKTIFKFEENRNTFFRHSKHLGWV